MNWHEKMENWVKELGKLIAEAENSILKFKPCSDPDCGRPSVARGLCSRHYRLWRKAECLQHGVKTLREIPKAPKVDERQQPLFTETLKEEELPDIQF
jgi:hypothetical protein